MNDTWNAALRLLTRREHAEAELLEKLQHKGHAFADIQAVLKKCRELDLQSDRRFAESICRTRIRQGYGPLRIRLELQSQKISTDLIEEVLESEAENWLIHAKAVWEKKYGNSSRPPDLSSRQKMQRFLCYRGFPAFLVKELLNE